MKRLSSIVLLLALSLAAAAQATDGSFPARVLTMNVGGTLMTRYNYTSGAHPTNGFSIRMARLSLSGRVMDEFAYNVLFKMEGAPSATGGPMLLDASVEWQRFKSFRVKIGQFKRPFTFESPLTAIDQGFYQRGMAVYKLAGFNDRVGEQASTGRDIGLMFQGDVFELGDRSLLHYMVGIFNGQGLNVADNNNGKDIIGGFWLSPAAHMRIGAFGWKGVFGRVYEGAYAQVDRIRYALSFDYTPGDWIFRSEYVHNHGLAFKNPYGGNLETDTTLGDTADAWYALMIAPLVPERIHAKLRYDVYRDNGAWDRAYNAYDLGFDYCLSHNVKFSAVGSFVNDRRLSSGSHNYFMFDFQMGLRF